MRKGLRLGLAPVLCGALAVGCGYEDKGESRAANDAVSSTEEIRLTGCVGVSPGGGSELALKRVQLAPSSVQASDAQTHRTNSAASAIREGSWVRLAPGGHDDQLREHVGQEVTLVGRVSDTGAGTMGTSGQVAAPQQAEPRADTSRAAADESHAARVRKEAGPIGQETMANGTAPLLTIQKIEGTGKSCNTELQKPENRR